MAKMHKLKSMQTNQCSYIKFIKQVSKFGWNTPRKFYLGTSVINIFISEHRGIEHHNAHYTHKSSKRLSTSKSWHTYTSHRPSDSWHRHTESGIVEEVAVSIKLMTDIHITQTIRLMTEAQRQREGHSWGNICHQGLHCQHSWLLNESATLK